MLLLQRLATSYTNRSELTTSSTRSLKPIPRIAAITL
jgi:hypothetical protein